MRRVARWSSISSREASSSATCPAMHSAEPILPARQSRSSTCHSGGAKRSSRESVTSSTEMVPSKSHRMFHWVTGNPSEKVRGARNGDDSSAAGFPNAFPGWPDPEWKSRRPGAPASMPGEPDQYSLYDPERLDPGLRRCQSQRAIEVVRECAFQRVLGQAGGLQHLPHPGHGGL